MVVVSIIGSSGEYISKEDIGSLCDEVLPGAVVAVGIGPGTKVKCNARVMYKCPNTKKNRYLKKKKKSAGIIGS